MKPIIIFKEKNKTGKFEFTESELQKLLSDAYESGYAEGKASISYPEIKFPEAMPLKNTPNQLVDEQLNKLTMNYNWKSCQDCVWHKEMMITPGKIYVGDTPCTWCINNNPTCTTSNFTNDKLNTNKSFDYKSYINSMNMQTPGLTEDDKKC